MLKIQIGGSPCTHWSIAQSKNRETRAEGVGWELFRNFLIARERFRPDFFLYENNKSAAQAIKDQISEELGVPLQYINSALVSAQSRERFYGHNFGDVPSPEDRGILLQDVLEDGAIAHKLKAYTLRASAGNKQGHSNLIRHIESAGQFGYMGVPVRVGVLPNAKGELRDSQSKRIYSVEGKSVPLQAAETAGGCSDTSSSRTGLYAMPPYGAEQNRPTYVVRDGLITIKDKQYPIKLPDGEYIIRKLSVTECCRLQTLPDDYCRAVSATQAYKGLGNAWTAEVIIHLLRHALAGVPRDEPITVLSMYDGIGTGRYCFDQLGYHNITYYAYEIDKFAMQIANSNYPDIIQCGDAFQVRDMGWRVAA